MAAIVISRKNSIAHIRALDKLLDKKTKLLKSQTDEEIIEIFGELVDELQEAEVEVPEVMIDYYNEAFKDQAVEDEPESDEEEGEPESDEEEGEPESDEEEGEPEVDADADEEEEEDEEEGDEDPPPPPPEEEEEEEEEEEGDEDPDPTPKEGGKKTVAKKSTKSKAKAKPKKAAAKKTTPKKAAPKKAAPKKAAAKKAAPKKTTTKKSTRVKDCFGFLAGSNTSKFVLAVAKKPQNMADVAAKGLGKHPKAFKKLEAAKLMTRDGDGVMSLTAKGKKLYDKSKKK
jgi:chemotaxis protein histidine kinase CheA